MNNINNEVIFSLDAVSHEDVPDIVNVRLGERIRALRRLRRMTQSDLARELGITFQQVQKYERGKNRLSVAMMLKISHFLDAPPDLLLAGLSAGDAPPQGSSDPAPSASEVAECINVMQLYCDIPDGVWRQRACEFLRLLAHGTRHAA